jgi:hypothetical protein
MRVSVQEAAEHLGTTVDAIRKRVQRGTIAHEKGPDGRVLILLEADRTRHDNVQDTTGHRQDREPSALISEMRAHNATLQAQLSEERQAHAEARRIIAGLVERIPAIEGPRQEGRESPETAAEASGRAESHSYAPGAQEPAQRPQSGALRSLGNLRRRLLGW